MACFNEDPDEARVGSKALRRGPQIRDSARQKCGEPPNVRRKVRPELMCWSPQLRKE